MPTHDRWIRAITDGLSDGRRPPGYFARAEPRRAASRAKAYAE